MTTRTMIDHALTLADSAGAEIQTLHVSPGGATLLLASCEGYSAVCEAAGAPPGEGRLYRMGLTDAFCTYDTVDKRGLVIGHECFAGLDCWEFVC